MIEQQSAEIRVTDLRELLRVGHGRVRALRHECIERCDTASGEEFISDWEKLVCVIVARLVGDDGEHALTALDDVECLFKDIDRITGFSRLTRFIFLSCKFCKSCHPV